MASSFTYGEGISKLQQGFNRCIDCPGKMRGVSHEMPLNEMLARVGVLKEVDILAIVTLIGKLSKFETWKNAMAQNYILFPRPRAGLTSRKISFRYWQCPKNLSILVSIIATISSFVSC
jgi:hypothetical protein